MKNNKQLQDLSALVSRINLATQLGLSYGGERDIYNALGYKKELTFTDYFSQYDRQEIATAIIDRPVDATWRGQVLAIETGEAEQTQFEKEWSKIEKKIKPKLIMADKLTGIGQYSVLLLGFSDTNVINDFATPVKKGNGLKLNYVVPVAESSAIIKTYVTDNSNERYGLPETYSITTTTANEADSGQSMTVHYSRVLHITDNSIDGVFGRPRLKPIFNRLQDIEKLSGGSAEMFWRGARPGYSAEVKPDYNITTEVRDNLKEQLDEFENNLRRVLTLEGLDLKSIQQQIADPSTHLDIQIQLISAQTGIPKRVLTGTERGELSSAQDAGEFASLIEARRESFCEVQILNPLIDLLMNYGILPKVDEYSIEWTSIHEASEKEKAEVGKIRAEAIRAYTSNGDSILIMPPRSFYEFGLGLNSEQIELIEAMQEEFSTEATGITEDNEDV